MNVFLLSFVSLLLIFNAAAENTIPSRFPVGDYSFECVLSGIPANTSLALSTAVHRGRMTVAERDNLVTVATQVTEHQQVAGLPVVGATEISLQTFSYSSTENETTETIERAALGEDGQTLRSQITRRFKISGANEIDIAVESTGAKSALVLSRSNYQWLNGKIYLSQTLVRADRKMADVSFSRTCTYILEEPLDVDSSEDSPTSPGLRI